MRRSLFISALLATALVLGGCRALNREVATDIWTKHKPKPPQVHHFTAMKYQLDEAKLKEIEFAGEITSGKLIVHYPRGLDSQAQSIADKVNSILQQVEQQLGVEIVVTCRVYLLRVDEIPQNTDIRLQAKQLKEFPFPLFAEVGNESYGAILSDSVAFPYLWVHELVEISLILPKENGAMVLSDVESAIGFSLNNETRWFREGLASYAGHLAWKMASEDASLQKDGKPFPVPPPLNRPFSSLARLGKDVFSWHQSSRRDNNAYYDASLGLFMLITDQFGPQAIPQIMAKVNEEKAVDGRDLIRIVDETLQTDIRRLVEEFRFPRMGVRVSPVTPAMRLNLALEVKEGLRVVSVEPNSCADSAKIQKDDVIVKVAGRPVKHVFDLEMALFEVRDQETVEVELWRKDTGTVCTEMPVEYGSRTQPTRNERRTSPETREIDIGGTL